ncbi:MAG: SGNH/GDSL hydrolase family protein [Novosphingobium sp.]|uniref:SGNH/GDSL hydrolase family protein n=1 Tax=Novosphingobium sp. TaxID=1874826 RepID=UPI00301B29BF
MGRTAAIAALALWAGPALAQTAPAPSWPPPSPPVEAPGEGMLDKPCPDQKGLWFAHPYILKSDWAWECHYAEANRQLAAPPRVVFIGDSITEGWIPQNAAHFGSGVVGRGIGGQTSPQVLVRFYQDVVRLRPRVVHIMVGTNDLGGNTGPNSPDMFKSHVAAMVDLARANGIGVVIGSILPAATIPWRAQIKPAKQVVVLNAWLRDLARAKGAVYADYHGALVNAEGGMNPDVAPDGIHPNAKGYAVMEPIAIAAIAEAEKQATQPR